MRIAVLGLGFMGSVHARASGAHLAAVYSSDARKLSGDLRAVQGNLVGGGGQLDFSRVKPYSELTALLADPEIDAVDVCLPTDLHESVTVDALSAGKHVLVEKPMALDEEAAQKMIDAAERSGRVLMAAQVLRFMPEYTALRDALPFLGHLRRAVFHRRCAAPAWGGWLKDPARSGGGVFDLMIHDVDMCLHLFGAPAMISATGQHDSIHAQLSYADDLVVVVTGGWEPAGAYPFRMEYSVSGERGTVEYSSAGRPPTLYTAEEKPLPLDARDGYAAEVDYFLTCCESGKPPELCPPRESARAVALMRQLLKARERNGEKIACNL
jgi:predicted dehydrogenase